MKNTDNSRGGGNKCNLLLRRRGRGDESHNLHRDSKYVMQNLSVVCISVKSNTLPYCWHVAETDSYSFMILWRLVINCTITISAAVQCVLCFALLSLLSPVRRKKWHAFFRRIMKKIKIIDISSVNVPSILEERFCFWS